MNNVLIQRIRPALYDEVEAELVQVFYDLLFRPIQSLLKGVVHLEHSADGTLRQAMRTDKIQYADGVFSGQFSAATSNVLRALGGRWDKRMKVYRMDPDTVPQWIKSEAVLARTRAKELHQKIKDTLKDIGDRLKNVRISGKGPVKEAEGWLSKAASKLQVMPSLTPEARERLEQDYAEHMKVYIGDFSRVMRDSLADMTEENATAGYRFSRLQGQLAARWNVSKNKARFLARQETATFMAKFREQRFADAGVDRYIWSTSKDERVRTDHKKLNGTEQLFSKPPIVDTTTGARANPGEDFNCRCLAIPILSQKRRAA